MGLKNSVLIVECSLQPSFHCNGIVYFFQELEVLSYQLRDERDHCDRLEDQIRDLTELHQHEILSIRAGVTDMEEKVQYQVLHILDNKIDRLSTNIFIKRTRLLVAL